MGEMTDSNGTGHTDRLQISIPIEAIGTDLTGRGVFCQRGQTLAISRHGAVIALGYALATDQEMTIRRLDTNSEADARVIGLISNEGADLVYGVSFLDPTTNLWDKGFPAVIGSDQSSTRMVLECLLCQAHKTFELNEIEVRVFRTNQQIQQFCHSCSMTTSWREVGEKPGPGPEMHMETQAQQPVTQPRAQVNRRKYGRIRGNISCYICRPGLTEEVVVCENRSRGGLRLITGKLYNKDNRIEVTAPYTPGSGNILLPARIVYIQRRENLFTLGVEYVRHSDVQQRLDGYSDSSGSSELIR